MAAAHESNGEQLQVVVFMIDGKTFGVDILKVQEILRMVEITPFPRMPDFALGAINLRGRIVPVINLRRRLGLPERPPGPKTCNLLVRSGEQVIGFLVDEVSEVIGIPAAFIENPDQGPAWMRSELFFGLGKLPGQLLVIINPGKLLSPQEESLLPHHGVAGHLPKQTGETSSRKSVPREY
jgi:purine-binding chemotaxis protein CheW